MGTWLPRRVDLARFAGRTLELEVGAEGAPATVSVGTPLVEGRLPAGDPPNLLLYVVDCLRADHVGAYGYPRPTTPHLDALARDSVVYENVYACASWTKPSVACLFTSLYPVFHGAQTVDDVLAPDRVTLAEALRGAGYQTGAYIANPFVATRTFGLARGFDRVVQMLAQPQGVNINALEADAADLTREASAWLAQHASRRFFLYLHSLDLHADYRPRPPFDATFLSPERTGAEREKDLYDNELAYNDRELGRLVEVLKREGLYDRTLIAVTADHGEEFGEHGTFRHGRTLYDSLLHVPLIVKLPGSRHQGRRVDALASNVDIAPTLLAAAGLAVPAAFRGTALPPVGPGGTERRYVFAEQLSPKEVLYAARDARFKAIHQLIPRTEALLFDVRADPQERRNLLPQAPAEARAVMQELLGFTQLGQEGYHLSIGDPDPRAWVTVEATTPGRFADVSRFSMDLEETLRFSPDRRRVEYRFLAGDSPRHLVFRTEPPGSPADFAVRSGRRPLAPAQVALGADGRPPAAVPFTVQAASLAVSVEQATALLGAGGGGARLWYVPPPAASRKAVIDPELEARLRALGYVQ